MELLYNPDRMPEAEIKATFVAREALVDELVELVKSQPDGAGVQHAVIIAPRGMGKTTVLLMVKFALKDRGLAEQWQAVKFPEESYGIYDLSDFWLETLQLIAADTADAELRKLADGLKTKYPNNDDLQEAAYAALKDWRRRHGKRLLLLVENFDQILEQINDERDNARLRDVLMNDGTVMLLGGATTFFKEARAYDQPLYNFFKICNLADLKFAQMEDLLRRRAELDRIADFENRLKENASRLRTLEYFTGGNPRLVVMLYRVVSRSDVTEVQRALEKLLDEVTPYYKAKVETLPPQQRKILDHIARISGETNEGLTPKEIAEAVRLSQNQVSSQLKRLSELGYVRAANMRGRSSYYTLSEPLYAIWHQMRFGRNARERMGWLVSFLKVWYAESEFGPESARLNALFRQYLSADRSRDAYDVLEHHHYLARAMAHTPEQIDVMNRLIGDYLDYGDTATVRNELLLEIGLEELSDKVLARLCKTECISEEQMRLAKALKGSANQGQTPANAFDRFLGMLNPDRELAGVAYESIRRRLIKIFLARGVSTAEELADETIDRVISRTEDLAGLSGSSVEPYVYGVANFLFREYLKKRGNKVDLGKAKNISTSRGIEEADHVYECLERCLQELPPAQRELLLLYYDSDKRAKIERRKKMASDLGLSDNALKIRVYRLRSQLYVSLATCLEERQRITTPKNLLGDWEELIRRWVSQSQPRQRERLTEKDRIDEQLKDLLAVIRAGNLSLAQQLIKESNMKEQLFPFTRAIDYLQTGDESLIEKLSPEVRGIVEEIVAKLKTVAPLTQAAAPPTAGSAK